MATAAPGIDIDLARLWLAAVGLASSLTRLVVLMPGRPAERNPPGEIHTMPTLMACLEGVVRIEAATGPVDLHAGEVALILPGTWHRHAPLRAGSASLGQGFLLGRSDLELAAPDRVWWFTIPEMPSRDLIDRACAAQARERTELVRRSLSELRNERARPMTPMPDAIQRMWRCLRQRRLEPIHARDIVRASGLSTTRAHALFKDYFGETPHQLLNRHRLEYACHLLRSGTPVGDTARQCGFRSRRHLTAAFRDAFALSPRAWTARHRDPGAGGAPE